MASPIGKREAERRNRNKTTPSGASKAVERVVVDPAVLEDTSLVPAPDPNPEWHWLAKMLYDSAKRSAIRDFYEPTDWAVLFFLLEQVDAAMQPQQVVVQSGPMAGQIVEIAAPMNGAILGNILKGFTALMFTEGDRRRLRMEIERRPAESGPISAPNVTDIRSRRLGGAS